MKKTVVITEVFASRHEEFPTLSVLVPVFNEEATIAVVLKKLLSHPLINEVIVINDGSTDATATILDKFNSPKLTVIHKENGGKGSAIQAGLAQAAGEYTLIQDADLEYDPEDIEVLLTPVIKGKAEVVYGSRFLGAHSNLLFWHKVGNNFLNLVVNVLYNTTLSDMETCYKLLPTKLFKSLSIQSNSFEMEPEITCKLLRRGVRIFEVPITYAGRNFSEGKKITWRDGFVALKKVLLLRMQPI